MVKLHNHIPMGEVGLLSMEHIHFRKFDVFRYTTKICKHNMYYVQFMQIVFQLYSYSAWDYHFPLLCLLVKNSYNQWKTESILQM